MKSLFSLAILLGLAAACSKQPPTSVVPAADPKAASTVAAKTADGAAPVPAGRK
jgi:hypothetical protein